MKQLHGGFPVLVAPILPNLNHGEPDRYYHGKRLDGLE